MKPSVKEKRFIAGPDEMTITPANPTKEDVERLANEVMEMVD